jgi:hypothetical protein
MSNLVYPYAEYGILGDTTDTNATSDTNDTNDTKFDHILPKAYLLLTLPMLLFQ